MQRIWFLLFSFPSVAFSLMIEPWLDDLWEFQFIPDFSYSYYPRVNHGVGHFSPSNDQLLSLGLGATVTESLATDLEIGFAHTPRERGFQSGAVQGRLLWLDDIIGDPISLTTGLSFRGVMHHWLSDVSCPYHGEFNAELNTAIGKEWSQDAFWYLHLFGFGALGMANRGLPWARASLFFEVNQQDRQQWEFSAESYFGFGVRQEVFVNHFHGYGSIHHQCIDLGFAYSYLFDFWGKLSVGYKYRVFAHSFPEHMQTFILRYQLPFSLF